MCHLFNQESDNQSQGVTETGNMISQKANNRSNQLIGSEVVPSSNGASSLSSRLSSVGTRVWVAAGIVSTGVLAAVLYKRRWGALPGQVCVCVCRYPGGVRHVRRSQMIRVCTWNGASWLTALVFVSLTIHWGLETPPPNAILAAGFTCMFNHPFILRG